MSSSKLLRMAGVLAAGATISLASAQAAVTTTGCGIDGCTLAELTGGGTITIDDVLFDGWSSENVGAPFGGLALGAINVVGSSTVDMVSLAFSFSPGLSIAAEEFAEFLIDFDASVSSSRTIGQATLQLGSASITAVGPENFAFVQTGLTIGALPAAEVVLSSEDLVLEDVLDLGALTALSAMVDIQGEAEESMAAMLSGFSIAFRLDGDLPPDDVVPIPGAALLMMTGLAGAGALRRRRAKA